MNKCNFNAAKVQRSLSFVRGGAKDQLFQLLERKMDERAFVASLDVVLEPSQTVIPHFGEVLRLKIDHSFAGVEQDDNELLIEIAVSNHAVGSQAPGPVEGLETRVIILDQTAEMPLNRVPGYIAKVVEDRIDHAWTEQQKTQPA